MSKADIKPVHFPQEVVAAFTDGDCWELASCIEGVLGTPVATVNVSSEMNCWIHAGNILPDGNILDIEGVWSQTAWLSEWSDRMNGLLAAEDTFVLKQWVPGDWANELRNGKFEHAFTESMESMMYADELAEEACPELFDI